MTRAFATIAIAVALGGCAAQKPMIPAPLELPPKSAEAVQTQIGSGQPIAAETRISETPKAPQEAPVASATVRPSAPSAAEEANVSFNFEQIPLPSFIQQVYGSILKRNLNVDPAIVTRQDLVTIRTGTPQTPTQVAEATRILLKSYGIAIVDLGNIVRVVPDTAAAGYQPEIRRGRALPETPPPLRPIFQLVELQVVRNVDVAQWIRSMFGNKVTLGEDPSRNAVLLSGQADDVTAAVEAVRMLDQPLMKGRNSLRITPVYMSAEDLARRLSDVLNAEGYTAGMSGPGVSPPISLVPIPAVNAVIAFAADEKIIQHVAAWAREIDKPESKAIGRSYFVYQVQNSDAQTLAATLERVISGARAAPPVVGGLPSAAPAPAAAASTGRVVVDATTNTIIFQGSGEDYGQIRNILELLDRQTKQALIEVTVAEVTLSSNTDLGVEWLIRRAGIDTNTVYGTLGGLSIGTSGFNYSRIDNPNGRTLLVNALASDNRGTILSSPRVVARNGETATIQVGQEVPIITSQQTTPTTGSTGVIQTVQYRNTGVILKVRPVIHSGNQVDLDVYQEVSSAQSTTTGVSTSPTFGTRKLETKMSLKEGSTVLLGGIISDTQSQGNAGIPLLKNIPIFGQLFRTDTKKLDRTELIILITPYIINNDSDAQAITEAFRKRLGEWARNTRLFFDTTKPPDSPSAVR